MGSKAVASSNHSIVKEMPECMNLDSVIFIKDYDVNRMDPEFKKLIYFASGYDEKEVFDSGLKELLEGLN